MKYWSFIKKTYIWSLIGFQHLGLCPRCCPQKPTVTVWHLTWGAESILFFLLRSTIYTTLHKNFSQTKTFCEQQNDHSSSTCHSGCCDGAPLRGDQVGGRFMSFGRVFLLLSLFEVLCVSDECARVTWLSFGCCTPLQSLGPRYLFVGCFYFWLFLLSDLCFLFETRRCSCDLKGFLLLHKTLFSSILCSN